MSDERLDRRDATKQGRLTTRDDEVIDDSDEDGGL